MFDRIARVYDPMNTAMSAGLHHRWRARAADLAGVAPASACSTSRPGPATSRSSWPARVARRRGGRRRLLRGDARPRPGQGRRARSPPAVEPRFEWADAMTLPYADDRFDAATVGFGVRNFADLERGLSEMVRVVRPGGRVVVLEMTTPTRPPLSGFYRALVRPPRARARRLAGALGVRTARGARPAPGKRSPRPTATFPTQSGAFRGRPSWQRRWSGAGIGVIGRCCWRAGSSRSTRAPWRRRAAGERREHHSRGSGQAVDGLERDLRQRRRRAARADGRTWSATSS